MTTIIEETRFEKIIRVLTENPHLKNEGVDIEDVYLLVEGIVDLKLTSDNLLNKYKEQVDLTNSLKKELVKKLEAKTYLHKCNNILTECENVLNQIDDSELTYRVNKKLNVISKHTFDLDKYA